MIWRRIVLALAATSGLAACVGGGSTTQPPTPVPPQADCSAADDPGRLCIIVLGDSIADGTPLTGDDRWWVQLESQLAAELPERTVVVDSWAVPGSRVDVLEAAARDQAALDSYDVAMVIEGVNDEVSTPLASWQPRYRAAIETLERRGLRVIVGTPPPAFERGDFTTRYDPTTEAIRDVAGPGRPLLDIARRWRDDGAAVASAYYSDLIHQGVSGQRLMAELGRDAVVAALAAPEATG